MAKLRPFQMRRKVMRNAVVLLAISIVIKQVLTAGRTIIGPKIHGLWICPDPEPASVLYNYTIGIDHNGMDVLNADGAISKPMMTVSKAGILLHKCRGGVSAENCEYFIHMNWEKGICKLLKTRGFFWSPAIDSVSPRFACPMDKYNYTLRGTRLDYTMMGPIFGSVPLDDWIWKAQIEMWNEKHEKSLCVLAHVDLRRYKIKS